MLRGIRPLSMAFALLPFLLLPRSARAEGTTCANPTVLVPDGRIASGTIANGVSYFFLISTRVGNSYSVEFMNPAGAAVQAPGTVQAFSNLACGTALTANDTTTNDPKMTNNGVRVSFTATTTNTIVQLTNNTGSSVGYTYSASDTTMFSPAWSSGGTYQTYYSFYNTTSAVVHGTITLTTTAGAAAGTTVLTIQPGRTAATNTVALATPRNLTGTAIFTHDGPPGAVLVESDIANFNFATPYIQPVKFQSVREIR